jgi:hypothetical protein
MVVTQANSTVDVRVPVKEVTVSKIGVDVAVAVAGTVNVDVYELI